MDREQLDAFDKQQKELIDKFGWSVIGVVATEDDPGTSFSYTVGLTEHGFPEFMIAGLPPEIAKRLLNDMGGRVFDRAERFAHGQRVTDLIRGYDAVVVAGDPLEEMAPGVAYHLYGRTVRVQQIVWPDQDGRFPWDAGWAYPPDAQPTIGAPAAPGG
ncbi:MAG TPA: DUF4262 domain-containing protein [Micromonosporaceae bacterium]|nr:DUF4262 domain-containing protein [Micromonosporaceae bacterium]